jgi:hypothetical protein
MSGPAAPPEDPVLDLASTDLRASEVAQVIRRILATGRSAYIDGDTGWLMASGDPGEPSPEALGAVESYRPASGFGLGMARLLATGYSPGGACRREGAGG